MKQSKRILSFFMAVVMMSSFVNIYAGAKAPYKDAAIPSSRYDDLDKPTLTLDQCSTMLLDYVDKVLAEKNIILDIGVAGTFNCTSVDNILNAIFNLPDFWLFPVIGMGGDLQYINKGPISINRRTSTPAAGADTNVIYSIFQFLSENRSILAKFIDGSFDWGLADSMDSILNETYHFNVSQSLKKLLFEQATPGTAVPETVTETADNMIQQILVNLITDAGAPGLAGSIDINSTAVAYDFLDKLLQDIYNLVAVPMLNADLKKAVREFCGVAYGDPAYPNGDESNLNEYAAVFDINFVVPAHTFAAGTTLVSELNSMLGEIVNAVIKGYTGWAAGNNTLLLNNLASAAKDMLKNTDSSFFEDYVAKATDAEIDAMNNQQLFSYIIRSVLNSTIGTMNIPADADTLLEAAWYALKEVLAFKVPQNDYAPVPKTLDGVLFMLADIAVYYINQTIDMNPAAGVLPGAGLLAYGQGFDATLLAVMKWFRTWYGGLFNVTLSQTDGWAALDSLVFSVIPRNWLPADVAGCKDLLTNRFLSDMLDMDTAGLFALFDRRADSELASKTIKKVAIDTAARLVSLVFPGSVRLTYTTFEQIISNIELKFIAEGLAQQLYNGRTSIVPTVLPLLNKWIGIDSPQTFVSPAIVLPSQIASVTTFPIRNDSTGINTGATNKGGAFNQDSHYNIKIESLSSNIPAITPTNLVGTFINSGESVNCTLSGTFAANQVLMLTMTYDVYTEIGAKLTDIPLTAMAFAYISGVVDDGKNAVTVNPQSENYHAMKYSNTYLNWPSAPVEPILPENPTPEQQAVFDTDHAQWVINLANYTAAKNASMASLATVTATLSREPKTSTGGHARDCNVTRGTSTVNGTLVVNGITAAPFTAIATTGDGGTWNIPYYTVNASPERPADGMYQSSFSFTATKTGTINPSETFSIPHKVVFYNDFGLPGLLASELNAKRDPAGYSDSAAWDDYIFALKNAVSVQYRPRTASTFMSVQAPAFEDAVLVLQDAVAVLEGSEIATGIDVLNTTLDAYEPQNTGFDYDDPAYNYFGLADYVPYTYLNYQREAANCRALLTTQQQLKQIDVAYALHRFYLYASRLIPVQATKARLNEAITAVGNPVQGQYTTLSWAAFAKALAFANTVNAQSETATDAGGNFVLRQTKVDTAREKLVEANKNLMLIKYVLPAEGWGTVVDLRSGFIYGLAPGSGALNKVQAGFGYSLVFHDGPSGPGTGATIEVVPDAGKTASIFYTVIIYGDVNGDSNIDSTDAGMVVDCENYIITLNTAQLIAADTNGDGNADSIDAGIVVDAENYRVTIDQSTGLVS